MEEVGGRGFEMQETARMAEGEREDKAHALQEQKSGLELRQIKRYTQKIVSKTIMHNVNCRESSHNFTR